MSLLDHPREKIADDKPMPLLAMHYYGKGLVLFSAVEETWRWRFNEADKYFARYWGQVVYAIGLPHTLGSKAGQLAIAGGEAVLGKPGQVYARLFTPEYRPLTRERVTAQVERLDAPPNEEKFRTVVFEAVPNQPGEYVATVPNDRVGRYALKVESGEEHGGPRLPRDAAAGARAGPRPDERGGPAKAGRADRRQVLPRGRPAPACRTRCSRRRCRSRQRKETLLWTYWPVLGAGGGPVHAGVAGAEVQQYELTMMDGARSNVTALARRRHSADVARDGVGSSDRRWSTGDSPLQLSARPKPSSGEVARTPRLQM